MLSRFFALQFLIFGVIAITNATPINDAKFIKMLQREYNLRDVGVPMLTGIAKSVEGTPRAEFYAAWLEMETLSRSKYSAYAEKLGYDHEPSILTSTKIVSGRLFFTYFYKDSMESISEEPTKYAKEELEKLRDLAGPEHRQFFDYVVGQEYALGEAFSATEGGDWVAGAKVFLDFVEAHR